MGREFTRTQFGVSRYELEVEIAAPPERVWKALIEETSAWWPRDFYTVKDPKGYIIEPRLGGRMYEDAGGGNGLVWYTVTGIEPGRRLQLTGNLFPAYGGPATMLLAIELEPRGAGTALKLSDCAFGRVDEKLSTSLEEGWDVLFGRAFKCHVEGARPGRG